MAKPLTFAGMLLFSTALTTPVVLAQTVAEQTPATETGEEAAAEQDVDVAGPGGDIVVVGRRDSNLQKATTQVISVLSSADIERTGEGDIAGALGRVTGLSLVGGGFVYVRGLGDRYSLALLNGSPLPSPEPLRRVVPLDLFPTDVIASSLVQKSYSANYPGEFGGGVINLTTLAIPKEPFLKIGLGISGDSETTGQLGYTHYGSETDWTGYDNGFRDTPPALKAFFDSGERIGSGNVDTGEIAKQLVNVNNGLVQQNDNIPANFSANVTGGTNWTFSDSELGIIATAGFSNKWRTRDTIQQTPATADLSTVDKDYRAVITDNRIVVNGLLGVGFEFGDGNKLRWTNFYVRDTLKQTSLAEGKQNNQRLGADFLEQNTAWYERQLITTQLTGEFKLGPIKIDSRIGYANSQREAPFELAFGYVKTNQAANPYGGYYINRLDNGQTGFGRATFSNLDENLWSGGIDLTAELFPSVVATVGYAYANTTRYSERREFQIIAPSDFPSAVGLFRPDYLLGTAVVEYYDIRLIETTESDPAFNAKLRTHGAYGQIQAELFDGFEVNAGVRFENGLQSVQAAQVFTTAGNSTANTLLKKDYYLPALTLTYKFGDNMQVRLNGSKTIARPQFRELIFQAYYDPESNRAFRGNPLLKDSQLYNAEARYEWYFDRDQRFSLAGFFKKIKNPIEAFTGFNDNSPVTSFANAPSATLYGAEAELQKYIPLDTISDSAFFASRRGVVIANYTYTKSKIKVGPNDTVDVFGTATQPATNFFVNGVPLTGQSDHLVNVQLGLEDTEKLSQQTILISYASDRVTSRGAAGLPDIIESPGLTVDFVVRQGIQLFGRALEMKFEARNIFGRGYEESQRLGDNRVFYNKYDVGTSFSASISAEF